MKFVITATLVFLLFISYAEHSNAQVNGGIKMAKPFTTRAVIIGISDYEDEDIPDLQFAHRDAQAFSDYLLSPAGGNLKEENIKTYFNETATGGNIHKALYWLITESKEGDNCIIYFSGHGDVETIYEDEPGHLLIHDSPASIYQINSLRVEDLQRIIKTLSVKKKAKVKLFTDACHSGKLAGSEISGTQATAAALNKQFGNELKIMSCQANEYSIEGPQWGGGRGVFSYHLIEGMTGLADADNDNIISLKEIQRYLEDKVHESLMDTKQTPVVIGDRNAQVALVHHESKEALLQEKNLDGLIASVDVPNDSMLKGNSNDNLVQAFYDALEEDILVELYTDNKNDLNSAEHYFDQILSIEELKNRIPLLKGDYIAHLQDDAQHAINLYLSADHQEMKKRWNGEELDFKKYADYLSKACELLEESHYLFPQIKSKQIYFEVLGERLAYEGKKTDSIFFTNLQKKITEAIEYQNRGAYLYNELGLLYERNKEYNKALEQFDIAIEQSPNWPLPYNNKSFIYNKLSDYDKAIELGKIAIELNSKFVSPYHNIAKAYLKQKNISKSIEYDLLYLNIYPDNPRIINNVGYGYKINEEYHKAIEYFDQAIKIDKTYAMPYINKGLTYMSLEKYQEAINAFLSLTETGYADANVYTNIGYCYINIEEYNQAVSYYNLAIKQDKKHISRLYLAKAFLDLNEDQKAIDAATYYVININSKDSEGYYTIACAYALQNNKEEFESNMLKAIDNGFSDKQKMEESIHLSSIRNTQVYQNILNKL